MKINERGFWECNNTDNHYYDDILCNSLIKYLKDQNCKSVIDIGCGHGNYTKSIIDSGILCDGFDGNPNTAEITKGLCEIKDFSKLQEFTVLYDYALSLEVAEHIPPEYESIFIENLINCNTKGLILSWAIPGQSGHGHFNERDNDYVIKTITEKGYTYNIKQTNILRKEVDFPWFQNTLLIFQKN